MRTDMQIHEGSIQEIHENANAAYALQCDPTEELGFKGVRPGGTLNSEAQASGV